MQAGPGPVTAMMIGTERLPASWRERVPAPVSQRRAMAGMWLHEQKSLCDGMRCIWMYYLGAGELSSAYLCYIYAQYECVIAVLYCSIIRMDKCI